MSSKRFGRNQKRKARNELESLTDKLNESERCRNIEKAELREVIDFQRRKVECAEEIIRVARQLNPDTVHLEPRYRGININHDCDSIMSSRLDPVDFISRFKGDVNAPIDVRAVRLDVLQVALQDDRFMNAKHCKVKIGEKHLSYAISESGLHQIPFERLVEEVAFEVARQFKGGSR